MTSRFQTALNTKMQSLHGLTNHHPFTVHKALPGFFPLYFQLPYLSEETCFQKEGSSVVEGTSHAVLGSSDQRKVPPSLSLFLKNEKISAFLYLWKGPEYRPYRPWAQISNHGRAYTQALLLYFKHSMCTFPKASYSPLTNSHHFARATIQQARQ